MILNPYLNFDGNAREAFERYQTVFGGELMMQKMSEAPDQRIFLKTKKKCCCMFPYQLEMDKR